MPVTQKQGGRLAEAQHPQIHEFEWGLHPRDRLGRFVKALDRLKSMPRGSAVRLSGSAEIGRLPGGGPPMMVHRHVVVERRLGAFHVRVGGKTVGRHRRAEDAAKQALGEAIPEQAEPLNFDPYRAATTQRVVLSPAGLARGIVAHASQTPRGGTLVEPRATAAHRAKFEASRVRYLTARAKRHEHEDAMARRYGTRRPSQAWMKKSEIDHRERILRQEDKAVQGIFDVLGKVSPRQWTSGVSAAWVAEHLPWSDALTKGKLSVTPQAGYGTLQREMTRFSEPL